MSAPRLVMLSALALVALGALLSGPPDPAEAQPVAATTTPREARTELERARRQAQQAAARASRLSSEAERAGAAAERATREAAALAARIQQAEAEIVEGEARLALIAGQRRLLDARLARRQQPIVRLTAALQNLARRPLALSALRPGSLRETVHLRAVLDATVPEIHRRTAALRGELARGRALEQAAQQALAGVKENEAQLRQRRAALAALAAHRRAASRDVGGIARREADRALALAEQARDLDDLVGVLDRAAVLRRELAALPGPLIRPARPAASQVIGPAAPAPTPSSTMAPAVWQLPVEGRTVTGFGARGANGLVSRGITLVPRAEAQVVAPAAGRIAFAGPYRGFGRIVIIEHGNGWTSLVTGLGATGVAVGEEVMAGSPLGSAGAREPVITFEVRRGGEPLNPLQFL